MCATIAKLALRQRASEWQTWLLTPYACSLMGPSAKSYYPQPPQQPEIFLLAISSAATVWYLCISRGVTLLKKLPPVIQKHSRPRPPAPASMPHY